MKIDGINITTFGAKLLNYSLAPSTIVNTTTTGYNSLNLILMDTDVQPRQMVLVLHVFGDTESGVLLQVSNLTQALHKKAEIEMPDGYLYTCVYQSAAYTAITSLIYEAQYTVLAVQHGTEITTTLTHAIQTVTAQGNVDTECVLTITPAVDLDSVTVMGITVRNLTANSPVIIDGRRKLISEDEVNKFADTDLISFPKLQPGPNQITISDPSKVTVQLAYYPTYI